MSRLATQLEHDIVSTFLPFSPQKIILFGSYASERDDTDSDIDLIIVYPTRKKFMDRLKDLYSSWNIPMAVDILAYTPEEFGMMLEESEFVRQATLGGEILYERA